MWLAAVTAARWTFVDGQSAVSVIRPPHIVAPSQAPAQSHELLGRCDGVHTLDLLGPASTDEGQAVAATDSGVFVAGLYRGAPTGFLTEPVHGGASDVDAFVAAFSPDGTPLWSARTGHSSNDRAHAVAATTTAVYVAGHYSNQISSPTGFAAEIGPTAGNIDAFVAALNPATGDPLWADRTGATGADYAYGIAVSNTAVYVTGVYEGTPTGFAAGSGPASGTEIFVAALGQ